MAARLLHGILYICNFLLETLLYVIIFIVFFPNTILHTTKVPFFAVAANILKLIILIKFQVVLVQHDTCAG